MSFMFVKTLLKHYYFIKLIQENIIIMIMIIVFLIELIISIKIIDFFQNIYNFRKPLDCIVSIV